MRSSDDNRQGRTRQRQLKLALGFTALFAVGLLVSGAFGQVTELGGSTTDTTAAATTDTTGASTTDTTSTATTSTDTTSTDPAPADPGTSSPATTPFAPTIASDQADYPPGGTVTLTGAGWGSGESVHLFVNDSAGDSWSYNADVTADAFGGLTNTFNLPNWFVANYSVKATGAAGETATGGFTDASTSVAAAPTGVTFSLTSQGFTDSACTNAVGGSNGNPSTTSVTAGTNVPLTGSANFWKLTAGAASAPTGATFSSWGASSGGSFTTLSPNVICATSAGGGNDFVYTATYSTVQNQTITVGTHAPSSAIFNSSFTVAATASSGLAVSYSSAGSCSNVGAVFTMTSGTGTCTVRYDQAGNASFNAAPQVTESVTAAKANQTISVTTVAPASKIYGGSFTVAASGGGSGNAVTFGSSGGCTNSGATFTMTSGTTDCSVSYDQAGNSNYNAAPQLTATVSATKAPLSVTANDKTIVFGDSEPAFDVSYGGFVSPDSSASLGGTLAFSFAGTGSTTYGPSATPPTNAGTYSVIPSGLSSSNYSFTYNAGTFTIDKKSASVTPNVATKVYGSSDPTFTGTLSGFLAGDGVTASYSRTTGETVAGGPYTISATLSPTGVLGNYDITYNTAAFTISQAAASVTPNAASKTYGNADPTFTGTLSGFLAGDNVTASYSRTAGETVAGSPYSITATLSPAAVLANYSVTYSTAAFTITTRAASVTPNAASKTYGGPDPTFTGTLSGFLAADGVTATYSRTTGETVAGSPYTISATLSPAAVLDNYTVTYNTAAFTIGKKAASVTPNAASKTYGDPDPTFTGTLTGFLAADGVTATYSRTTGEIVGGNPYTISATLSPAGVLGNYDITYDTATFTIDQKTASVTPAAASKTYGDVDPTFTGTLNGFLVADGVTATYSRAAGETVADGPYEISATLSPASVLGNYDITYNTADFTIDKKSASVTPDPATKVYGSGDPGFTGSLSGFLAADGVTATYSRTAGETVAGSPYAIGATLSPAGVLGNYDITYNTAEFTISRAAASVTPNTASKTYGDDDPTFTGTLTGFLAGDNVTASYSRTAGETVAGGPYTISATLSPAGVLDNYFITSNTAAFTINPKSASVTPDAATKTYGDADPTLTGSLSGFLAGDSVTASYSRTAGETVTGGPYAISATLSPAGVLGNYAITYDTAAFTITTKSASVTPDAASKTYGSADPALTGTLSGFLVADGVTATYSRTAGETVGGNPYTISATLSPVGVLSNYSITYNTANFTINRKTASVTPDAASKTYGSPDPTLTGSLVGFLSTDGVSATYSRTAGETVGDSPYEISATLSPTGVLDNYDITYNTADFTIGKKNASVTPDAASKIYGNSDPALTGTLSGFLAGDGVTASYSRTAGETVGGSPYTISATLSPAAALGNYTITYNTANFTISRRAASVTPDAASKTYGDADPTFSGTLSGFLPGDGVTATYSRNAGETVGGSPYSISATLSPAGVLGNYTITDNTALFTIGKKAASVTPNADTKVYGSADPSFTGTLSGFLAGDGVTATYGRTAGETVAGGPYTISATLSPAGVLGNYTITYNTALFTIGKKAASVTPNAAGKTYGDADPALTGTLTGFLATDSVSATYSRTAGESVAGSPYTISASLSPAGVLDNYDIAYNTAAFTIDKAPLSATAADMSKVYGDANPTFTGSLVGVKNGEAITATYSSTATAASGVGPYAIVPQINATAAVLANYQTPVLTNGTLTITRAPLSALADNKTKILNAPNPTFTGTLTGVKNGDAITLTFTTTATQASPIGTYPIHPVINATADVLANYQATPGLTDGTLTIGYATGGTCLGSPGHSILQPINADGTSVAKGGSTVPAKFRVCDANGVSIGTPGTVASFRLVATITGLVSSVLDDAVTSTTPDTAFRWSSTDQQWIFNINTKGMATNKTYVYLITLNDGSTIQFQFGLK